MSNDRFLHDRLYHGQNFDKFNDKKICICGVGTLGSNLVDNLVRQNIQNLVLVDDDRVEQHNLGNQIWTAMNLGQKKVDAAKMHAYNSVGAMPDVFDKRLTSRNTKKVFKGADLIIDCFDNAKSRALIKGYGQDNNVDVLHAGLAEDYCEVVWNDAYQVPNDSDEDVCEYPLTRNVSMVAVVLITQQVINWICGGELKNSCFTLNDFVLSKYN